MLRGRDQADGFVETERGIALVCLDERLIAELRGQLLPQVRELWQKQLVVEIEAARGVAGRGRALLRAGRQRNARPRVPLAAEADRHLAPRRRRVPEHDHRAGGLELTTREADVLAVLAEGLTNKRIAARLYLSPGTVEKHVERILTETGQSNRAALAATAARWRPATSRA